MTSSSEYPNLSPIAAAFSGVMGEREMAERIDSNFALLDVKRG